MCICCLHVVVYFGHLLWLRSHINNKYNYALTNIHTVHFNTHFFVCMCANDEHTTQNERTVYRKISINLLLLSTDFNFFYFSLAAIRLQLFLVTQESDKERLGIKIQGVETP